MGKRLVRVSGNNRRRSDIWTESVADSAGPQHTEQQQNEVVVCSVVWLWLWLEEEEEEARSSVMTVVSYTYANVQSPPHAR